MNTRWLVSATLALALAACSPKYDWREVRGQGAKYVVMLPAKPASFTRDINLGGSRVPMTMTAAEVDRVSFAVATAELPNAAHASAALAAMKKTMVANIRGQVRQEKPVPGSTAIEVEAVGVSHSDNSPQMMLARFLTRDKRVYQLVVIGPAAAVQREQADIFFASFKTE